MEQVKAPEKLYFYKDEPILFARSEKKPDANIEYTRTDAFTEKAVKWIEEIYNHHHIMRYSDSCEPSLSELTEWFKNYMKGG